MFDSVPFNNTMRQQSRAQRESLLVWFFWQSLWLKTERKLIQKIKEYKIWKHLEVEIKLLKRGKQSFWLAEFWIVILHKNKTWALVFTTV